VRSVNVDLLPNDDAMREELHASKVELTSVVDNYLKASKSRKQLILDAVADGNWQSIPTLPPSPVDTLSLEALTLESSAEELDKADDPQELKKLENELWELEDRD